MVKLLPFSRISLLFQCCYQQFQGLTFPLGQPSNAPSPGHAINRVMLWTIFSFCLIFFHLCVWLMASPRQTLLAAGMKLKYSIPQLLTFNNHSIPMAIATIKELGLKRRPRYIHRSFRRKFVYHQPDLLASYIPSFWTTVAHLPRHQSSVALCANNAGSTARSLHAHPSGTGNIARSLNSKQIVKRGVDTSVLRPLQRSTTASTLKIELFNTQSLTNKASFIQDHIMEKELALMCLTETWHQPGVYSALNEACPPGYSYLERARNTGRGGGLAIIH